MKITLLTSNKNRHNYLINLLSGVSDELYVIQECDTIFPGIVSGHYQVSPTMKKYFENVNNAQFLLFGNSYVNSKKKKYQNFTYGFRRFKSEFNGFIVRFFKK